MKYKTLHKWNVTPKEAIEIQKRLAGKIILKNFVMKLELIAGVDVSYKNDKSRASVAVLKYPEFVLVEYKTASCKAAFPYIPGLLTFREGPAILKCIKKISIRPDVFLFDGQGITHPRKMGIATHMGILLNAPTIGCAKSFLYGKYKEEPRLKKGSFVFIENGDRKIGVVLRTRDNTNPIYVSPGYKIDLTKSIKITLKSLTRYRIPEPLRLAHHLAKTKVIGNI